MGLLHDLGKVLVLAGEPQVRAGVPQVRAGVEGCSRVRLGQPGLGALETRHVGRPVPPTVAACPQWAVVGDTFPVGCRPQASVVFCDSTFQDNPDLQDPRYRCSSPAAGPPPPYVAPSALTLSFPAAPSSACTGLTAAWRTSSCAGAMMVRPVRGGPRGRWGHGGGHGSGSPG